MKQPNPFDTEFWSELEEIDCPCQGSGWGNINNEWKECAIHFEGQLHPESRDLLLDDPAGLRAAERASCLAYRINKAKEEVAELQTKLRHATYNLTLLELEQVNKTPTTKVKAFEMPENCYPTVQMKAVRP